MDEEGETDRTDIRSRFGGRIPVCVPKSATDGNVHPIARATVREPFAARPNAHGDTFGMWEARDTRPAAPTAAPGHPSTIAALRHARRTRRDRDHRQRARLALP